MIKIISILLLLSILIIDCLTTYSLKRYTAPIPTADYYKIDAIIQIMSREEFQKEIDRLYPNEDNRGVAGITRWYGEKGQGTILLPRKVDGSIDLETLGHEMFYHIMEHKKH